MSHFTTVTHHDSPGSGGAPAYSDKPPASRRGWRFIGAVLAGSIVLAALLLVLANLASAKPAQKKALPDLKPFLVEDIYPGKTGSEPVKDIDPVPLEVNEVEDTETGSSEPDNVLLTKKWIFFQAPPPSTARS